MNNSLKRPQAAGFPRLAPKISIEKMVKIWYILKPPAKGKVANAKSKAKAKVHKSAAEECKIPEIRLMQCKANLVLPNGPFYFILS